MNAELENKTETVDDDAPKPIYAPKRERSTDWETEEPLAPGAYSVKITDFKEVDKPDWKIEKERAKKRADGKKEDVDPVQWRWKFEFLDEEVAGRTLVAYTSRSLYETSVPQAWASAVMGHPIPDDDTYDMTQLVGKLCQAIVVLEPGKGDTMKNYVNSLLPPKRINAKAGYPRRWMELKGQIGDIKDVKNKEIEAAMKEAVGSKVDFAQMTEEQQKQAIEWAEAIVALPDDYDEKLHLTDVGF